MRIETQDDPNDPLGLSLQGLLGSVIAYRIRLFLSGVLFPIGCILFTLNGPPTMDVPWQSGRTGDYIAMLLTWPGYTPFFPLLVFSQVCLSAWLLKPSSANRLFVRLGIYGGFILALQFLLFVMMVSAIMTFIIAAFVGPLIAMIVALCVRLPQYARRFAIRHVMILTAIVAVLIALMQLTGVPLRRLLSVFFGAGMYALMATPVLCALAYIRATIEVAKQAERKTRMEHAVPAAITWIVTWAVSWKLAVDIMLDEYSRLPTTDPNCYVSSAAAHGHRVFVGSHERLPSGQRVNMQMRRLKFLELALKGAAPRFHKLVRKTYDRFGPKLATACQRSRWFADGTYLLLKPLEWVAEIIRVIARVHRSSIRSIYDTEAVSTS